jgi:hypothetical protein
MCNGQHFSLHIHKPKKTKALNITDDLDLYVNEEREFSGSFDRQDSKIRGTGPISSSFNYYIKREQIDILESCLSN